MSDRARRDLTRHDFAPMVAELDGAAVLVRNALADLRGMCSVDGAADARRDILRNAAGLLSERDILGAALAAARGEVSRLETVNAELRAERERAYYVLGKKSLALLEAAGQLAKVLALIDHARKVSPSDRMTVMVGDLEHALGLRDQPARIRTGSNE